VCGRSVCGPVVKLIGNVWLDTGNDVKLVLGGKAWLDTENDGKLVLGGKAWLDTGNDDKVLQGSGNTGLRPALGRNSSGSSAGLPEQHSSTQVTFSIDLVK